MEVVFTHTSNDRFYQVLLFMISLCHSLIIGRDCIMIPYPRLSTSEYLAATVEPVINEAIGIWYKINFSEKLAKLMASTMPWNSVQDFDLSPGLN